MFEIVTPAFDPTLTGGEGVYVVDADGACYLDCRGVAPLGHGHPRVVAAIERQARSLHAGAGDASALQQRLAAIAAPALSRSLVFGAMEQALDAAATLASRVTGRGEIVLLTTGLEGRTQLPHWRSDPSPVHAVRRVRFGDVAALSDVLRTDQVAAVIAEPLPNGVVPRLNYWPIVRDMTARAGVLLGFDESRTGLLRTGRWFAAGHWDTTPDFTLLGDTLANGLPVAALLCGDEMADLSDGPMTANPVSLAAAEALVDELSAPAVVTRLEHLGVRLKRDLPHLHGMGMLLTLDADDAVEQLAEHGVLATSADGVLTLAPPLTISEDELTHLIDVIACMEFQRGDSL
jgi:acetylornithine/succinyldiaminopimelate/putrescine aminotransferase